MSSHVRANIRAMAGYVPGEQPREGEFIKLNTNENPYPPSPRVFEAIQNCLTSDRLRKYPDPLGHAFREAAGRALGVAPDQILIGNGSDDILTIVTRTFVPEGGLIVSPTPSYLLYESLAQIQGARFQTVPYHNWSVRSEDWPIGTHLTFLANPNSPTGTFIDSARLRNWPGPLVIDEAYADFADRNCLALVGGTTLVSRTLSKSYGLAGIRFGFGVAEAGLIREFNKVKDSYNCDVLSLAAATAAIADQEYMNQTRVRIRSTRTRLTSELRGLGFTAFDSQANFVWSQRADRPVKPLYEALKQRQILVRYMNYPGFGDGLRISVGTDVEIDRLLTELRTLL